MIFFFFEELPTLLGQSEKIITVVNIDFNQSDYSVYHQYNSIAEQLCIIKKKIISSPGGQKQCASSPQIWCEKIKSIFLYPPCFVEGRFQDLLHGQTSIAIHSTLFTASSASTISKKYIRHGLKETNLYKSDHPQCI